MVVPSEKSVARRCRSSRSILKGLFLWVIDSRPADDKRTFQRFLRARTAFSSWQPKNARQTIVDKLVCI